MSKPIIGVTPLFDDAMESIWMLPCYMEGIKQGGGIPVIVPFSESEEETQELAQRFDGFLFTGGQDVDPALYGQEKLPCCSMTSPCRDTLEKMLFSQALRFQKPMLGICRGLQFINVALGGSLYQDIKQQIQASSTAHSQGKPYDAPAHRVNLCRDTPLYELVAQDEIMVNSLHHQAISKLADALKPAAVAPDGIIEAVYMPGQRFVMAVQWHPEFMFERDAVSASLFKAFVDSCGCGSAQ